MENQTTDVQVQQSSGTPAAPPKQKVKRSPIWFLPGFIVGIIVGVVVAGLCLSLISGGLITTSVVKKLASLSAMMDGYY